MRRQAPCSHPHVVRSLDFAADARPDRPPRQRAGRGGRRSRSLPPEL